MAIMGASRGNVHFTITAKDFASRTVRGVGHSFTFLGMRAKAADRSLHNFFWRGTDDVKMWMRVILLGMPLIPPLLVATSNAAAGMLSALVSIGPGVGLMIAALIGNFKRLKREAGFGKVKESWSNFLAGTRDTSLKVLTTAFGLISKHLVRLIPLANAFGEVFNRWLVGLEKGMSSPAFDKFLTWLMNVGSVNFASMLNGFTSFIKGIGNLAMAFTDSGLEFTAWFENMGDRFNRWAKGLQRPKALEGFLNYFRETWPSVKEMFREFGRAVANILRGVAPLAKPMAQGLAAFFRMIANADPAHIRKVALAFLAFTTLRGLWAVGASIAALGGALASFKRNSKGVDKAARRNQGGFVAMGKGGRAGRLGVIGLATAALIFAENWIKADKDTSRAWGRLKRQGSALGSDLEKALGPSLRAIVTGTFDALATGASKTRQALPKIATAAQIAARGAAHAFEIILKGLGKMLGGFATAAAKLAPFNPAMARIAGAMLGAAGKAYGLARSIARLRSKSITVTTNYVRNVITRYTSVYATRRDPSSGDYFGYATGGRPPVGRASWVGEKGPELFVPDRPGTIIPADKSKRMAASPGASGDDADLAKAVAKALANVLQGATLRLVDGDGTSRRAYLVTGGNV